MYLEYRGPKTTKTIFQGSRRYEFVSDSDFEGRKIARDSMGNRNVPDEDAEPILNRQISSSAPCIFKVEEGEALMADSSFRSTILGNAEVILQILRDAGVDIDALRPQIPEAQLDQMTYPSLKKLAASRGWSDIVKKPKAELLAGIKERMYDAATDPDANT